MSKNKVSIKSLIKEYEKSKNIQWPNYNMTSADWINFVEWVRDTYNVDKEPDSCEWEYEEMEKDNTWIDVFKELPDKDADVNIKLSSGEIILAWWINDKNLFQFMGGNFYHAKKSESFKEYNVCTKEYTGDTVAFWRRILWE